MYKIAVYAICRDEAQFVDKWIASMSEADYVCVLDTGSKDNTYELLCQYQKQNPTKYIIRQKIITPWRFDTARNESMQLIPKEADLCICTDLDEILEPGWANDFRSKWSPTCNRLIYLYAWSHDSNNHPARVFWYNKCHDNSGRYYWTAPVHEFLNDLPDEQCVSLEPKIYLHHYPDYTKSRATYLPLLEQRAKEYPDDTYGKIYLAHEYYYHQQYQKCIDYIHEFIADINVTDTTCLTDLYMFLGDSYHSLGQFFEAEHNYLQGIQKEPTFRDNYLKLGELYLTLGQYDRVIRIVNDGLLYGRRKYSWLETDQAWNQYGFDLLSVSYYYLGAKETALMYAYSAHKLAPHDTRLLQNYQMIKEELKL